MTSDRLTPLDATFLELEEADDAAHMHIGSLMVFEARPGLPPTLGRACAGASSSGSARCPATAVGCPSRTRAAALARLGRRSRFRHRRPRPAGRAARPGRPRLSCSTGPRATGPSGSTAAGRSGRPARHRPRGRPLGDRHQDTPCSRRRRRGRRRHARCCSTPRAGRVAPPRPCRAGDLHGSRRAGRSTS